MSLYISGVSQLKTSQKKSIYIIKDAKLFRAKGSTWKEKEKKMSWHLTKKLTRKQSGYSIWNEHNLLALQHCSTFPCLC